MGSDAASRQMRLMSELMCAQSSYISGIAQGANVGKDQVIILGVTMGSSVTVNTQVGGSLRGFI